MDGMLADTAVPVYGKANGPIGFFFPALSKLVSRRAENQRWLGWFKLVFKRAENQNVAGLASGQFRIIRTLHSHAR